MNAKPAIAIIIPGGIGTGKNNMGVPVLERIVKLLAADFQITVFQLFPCNPDYKVSNFEIVEVIVANPILRFLKLFFVFRSVHRRKKFQTVHGFWILPCGFLAVVLGKIFKIKSVVSVLGGDAIALPEIQYGQLRKWINRKLIFWTLNQATEPNALTQYLVNNLQKAGYRGKALKVIPWGINTELFAFKERRWEFPIRFLHIGNLHPIKDQDTLLRAFKIISDQIDARLTIIGEGEYENRITELVQQLQLTSKVVILKQVQYESLPAHYYAADILLHTSRSEGQSEVVTEAMNSGMLVCGTCVGLMYDLADASVTVDVQDFRSLGNKVLAILRDSKQINELIESAVRWTKIHSIQWTANQYKALYVQKGETE